MFVVDRYLYADELYKNYFLDTHMPTAATIIAVIARIYKSGIFFFFHFSFKRHYEVTSHYHNITMVIPGGAHLPNPGGQ